VGRLVGLALVSAILGCYPEFSFVADDAGTSPIDTSVVDVANDAIFPADDTTSPMVDTAVVDTAKADTFVPPMDTAPPPDGCAALSGWAFCRDFDDASSVGAGWVGTYTTGTSAVFLDSYRSRSPTVSMKSSVGPSTGESAGNVHTKFTASTALRPMAIDLWAWFDKVPTGDGPLFVKLTRESANRGISIYLGLNGLAVDVNEPGGTQNYPMPGTLSASRWYHIRLETVLTASTTSGWFKLYVDDMATPKLTKTGIGTTTVDGTDVKLNVGYYIATAPVGYNAWIDDVAFYWL
jgi:hypothetical protein